MVSVTTIPQISILGSGIARTSFTDARTGGPSHTETRTFELATEPLSMTLAPCLSSNAQRSSFSANLRSTSSKYTAPISRPSWLVTRVLATLPSRSVLTTVLRSVSGRIVESPGSITSSTRELGSPSRARPSIRPRTMCRSLTTIQTFLPAARTRFATSPSLSPMWQAIVVTPYHSSSVQFARSPAFCRQWGSEPVRFPGLVVVNLGESKGFEPRRGPRAHVSEPIHSIHNNRAIFCRGD